MLKDERIGKLERSARVQRNMQAAKLRAHASRLICPRPFQVSRDFDDPFIGRFVRTCFTKALEKRWLDTAKFGETQELQGMHRIFGYSVC